MTHKEIPKELFSDFTLNGKIPVLNYFLDDTHANGELVYDENKINYYRNLAQNKKEAYYGKTDTWLYSSLEKYPMKGKSVLIIGSNEPFYEEVCQSFGAKKIDVSEYRKITSVNKNVNYFLPNEIKEKYDIILSISSFEHDGLGRYGDPINPNGDINSMKEMKKYLMDDGFIILSVPVGEDCLVWNAHRIYGKIRLPKLLNGWEVIETFGYNENNKFPMGNFVQPIFILKKKQDFLFDEIVSLGYNCYVADVLKKGKFRKFAYPFDWTISNLSLVEKVLKNPDSFPLLSSKELEYITFGEEHYYYITSEKTLISIHDFKSEDKNSPINNEIYEKYIRRIERFKNILNSGKKILFIRLAKFPRDCSKEFGMISEQDTPEKIGKLADLISELYPNLKFKILFCCDRADVDCKPVTFIHPKVITYVRYNCEIIDHHLLEKIIEVVEQNKKIEEKIEVVEQNKKIEEKIEEKIIVKDRVSVIIPTYNRGKELINAVSSVINQTYRNIEVIVVDDCSTNEESKKILIDLKQQGIKVLTTSVNSKNPAIPRNLGMRESSGEWTCFLDDDDMFLPNKVDYQLKTMKFLNSLFSCSDAYYSKEINYYSPLLNYELYHQGLYKDFLFSKLGTYFFPPILTKKEILVHNWIMTSGVMLHSSLTKKVGEFIPAKQTGEGWEDYNYWLRVLDYTNVNMINIPLIFYNMTPRQEKKWHQN